MAKMKLEKLVKKCWAIRDGSRFVGDEIDLAGPATKELAQRVLKEMRDYDECGEDARVVRIEIREL